MVDASGRVEKALSIEAISHSINADPSTVPSTAEMLAAQLDEERPEEEPAL